MEGNVRSFLQVRGKVNKGIRSTILNEPDMFFAYNNGIAATAYDVKVEMIEGMSYITEISSLQIVNGGQTTASLATALIKDKKDNSEQKIRKIFIPDYFAVAAPPIRI
ncbi:MAG: AIPR family protein, partial [Eubacteriales bacterium]|nr:AIPR family protein [Eubacteriales bacterium]